MKCERCGRTPSGYALFDYCAKCGRNLCEKCIEHGCCGSAPAASGMCADYANATNPQAESERF